MPFRFATECLCNHNMAFNLLSYVHLRLITDGIDLIAGTTGEKRVQETRLEGVSLLARLGLLVTMRGG